MSCSKAQIVATIGPASMSYEVIKKMVAEGLDVFRFNFSWSDSTERSIQLETIRRVESELNHEILIIQDLSGPRVQYLDEHGYDKNSVSAITDQDIEFIKFGIENKFDYVAISFVGSAEDIIKCREVIKKLGGNQRIIAKIERKQALENFQEILDVADAIMIARGDLGNEVPIEKIPFIQADLIKRTKIALKPVITATQMLTSMVHSSHPTRAEVTDVANAIIQGSDALMLSEETSIGKYPVEVVMAMEKIAVEAEKHLPQGVCTNILSRIKNV